MEPISAQQAAEEAKGLTFEIVWAALMEDRVKMNEFRQEMLESRRESQRETQEYNRKMQEYKQEMLESNRKIQEYKQEMLESKREADIEYKKANKIIGGLGNSLGRLIEDMFSAGLYKKFCDIGYTFTKQAERVKFTKNNQLIAEVDLYLENGDYIMLVEIKTTLAIADVDYHLEQIGVIREYMDARRDARKIVGAIAGGTVDKKTLAYAHNNGLYVIVQSGEAVKIMDSPEGFTAREW